MNSTSRHFSPTQELILCLLVTFFAISSRDVIAQELRLSIEATHRSMIPSSMDVVRSPDGTLVVNTDDVGENEIFVLNANGNLKRCIPALEVPGLARWEWRVKSVLADGSMIVDGDSFILNVRRWRLESDGTPVAPGIDDVLPSGPITSTPSGGLIIAPVEESAYAPLVRFEMKARVGERDSLTMDTAYSENVHAAASGQRAVALAATDQGKVWAWLVPRKASSLTQPRLARFLADGRLDPTFKPAAPWLTGVESFGELYPFIPWIGPLPDGRVLVIVAENRFSTLAFLRLLPDGRKDVSFQFHEESFSQGLVGDFQPLLALPDGGALVRGYLNRPSVGVPLVRLSPDGSPDLSWRADLPDSILIQAVRQPNGCLVVVYGNPRSRGPRPNITRLNPDGSRDTTFDVSSRGKASALIRVFAEGLQLGRTYEVLQGITPTFQDLSGGGAFEFSSGMRQPFHLGLDNDLSSVGAPQFFGIREVKP